MADLTDKDEFEKWLRNQPHEVVLVISARAALRALPVFMDDSRHMANGEIQTRPLVLSVIQALALIFAVAKYPKKIQILITKSDQFAASTFAQPLNASGYAAEAAYSAYNYVRGGNAKDAALAAFNSSAAVANHAATAVGASLDAAIIASSAMHVAAARDAEFINNGYSSDALVNAPLWLEESLEWVTRLWRQTKASLDSMDEGWDVWTRWYDSILEGKPTPGGEELDIFRVRLKSEEDWKKSLAEVNQLIKRKETEISSKSMSDGEVFAATYSPLQVPFNLMSSLSTAGTGIGQSTIYWPPPLPLTEADEVLKGNISKTKTTGEELAKYSSPQPTLTSDGKLDVRPNAEFDALVASQDLPTLPIRQLRLIDVILSDLPQQAPPHLKSSLAHYGDELKARGINPFLGILKDMAEIIAVASAANDGEWLQPGLRKSFELFNSNHIVFIEHFPLDIEREKRFAEIEVYEDAIVGDDFVRPFKEAEVAAKAADFVTADTIIIMERMRELAEITAYMPPAHGGYLNPKNIVPLSNDRFAGPTVRLSVKKRLILQARGFWSACVKVLAPIGNAIEFLDKLRKLIEMIYKFFPDGY
jgi:hypothetical protein